MGRVAGVFDNPPGFPCTPPGVDILEGGKLTSNNVAGSSHDPLQSPAVASGAVTRVIGAQGSLIYSHRPVRAPMMTPTGQISIITGTWSNGKKLPGLINVIFY